MAEMMGGNKPKDNTALYIGLGVGGVVIIAMMMMMQKKIAFCINAYQSVPKRTKRILHYRIFAPII